MVQLAYASVADIFGTFLWNIHYATSNNWLILEIAQITVNTHTNIIGGFK